MHQLSIKEMYMAKRLRAIHPMNVLLGSADSLISSDVQITTQAAQALNGWLADVDDDP